MRAAKVCIVLAGLFALARYSPVVYKTSQFNDFVQMEVKRNTVSPQLEEQLLSRARVYFLPVRPDDIKIRKDGILLRVEVDYQVPIDFVVFTHVLSFHASGAGVPRGSSL